MFWEHLINHSDSKFKRATGIHKAIFLEMVSVIKEVKLSERKHPNRGRKTVLTIENQLLLVLMYYREYRTQWHIGTTYGLSENRVCDIIKDIERILISDKRYHLPSKKVLLQPDNDIEVILVDVSETPIERPKKNKEIITQGKRKDIHKR